MDNTTTEAPKTVIEDIPAIDLMKVVHLGRDFHQESSFRRISFDEGILINFLSAAIVNDSYYLRGAYHRGLLTGVLVGYLTPYVFSQELHAVETALYVIPDKRGSSAAFKLIKNFEQWAISKDAREVIITIRSDINKHRVTKLYNKLGFQSEGSFHSKIIKE